ncbi:hypothetical protein [Paenibacillus hunanensis]|uniref:Uncharacterized protein n=1 Tax=Paenibacillus hunanensis TaxID=539262 RepID=A0ABU1IV33_9BACL|nr:hypothetical protein [Paenibacillus hunanensis]MDR6243134.1 hypothetical protein [Paenibacillus hunanensis]GGJ11570.1 hypothetical protein GCM10008022_20910 [Paenibacillus hunanensis]
MTVLPKVDDQGYFVEDIEVLGVQKGVTNHFTTSVDPAIRGYIVGYPIPEGLFKPRLNVEQLTKEYGSNDATKWYDGSDPDKAMPYWVEGLTPEEIKEITKEQPLSDLEKFKQQIAEQQAAMWDFILPLGGV